MTVDDRLRRIAGINPQRTSPSPSPATPAPDRAVAERIEPIVRKRFPLETRHGRFRLADVLDDDRATLAPLGCDLGILAFDPRDVAFFDTETTGLEGGAACRVFLVGLGYFEDDAFVVEQHTLTDLDEEPAFLGGVRDAFARFRGVATFFGKSFDRPRLEDRYAYHGLPDTVPNDPHVDLHTLSRRLWGDRLTNCKLQTIEKQILDFHREDDLASSACPEAWWSFVRGDAFLMSQVHAHNLDDILSLATLAHAVARGTIRPEAPRARVIVAQGLEALDRHDEGLELLQGAFEELGSDDRPFDRATIGVGLGDALKRAGRHADAAVVWEAMVARDDGGNRPLIELAMFHEHRSRDLDRALELTLRALRRVRPGEDAPLRHRAKRLLRKGARTSIVESPASRPVAEERLVAGDGTLASRLPLGSLRRRGQDLDAPSVEAQSSGEEQGDGLG